MRMLILRPQPVLTAPFGGDALFAQDGHLAVTRANAVCGTASIVPEVGSFCYEDVAAATPAAARIGQLFQDGQIPSKSGRRLPRRSMPWTSIIF
jgi:isopentenyl diphosphate isomerase/L-lactate dehydrogenase-like FMN-dependent dehydrogenase